MTLIQRLTTTATLMIVMATSAAQARIQVLFHPTDPTLEKIGDWIREARGTVDIAMYSMDTSPSSPLVQRLSDPVFQARLKAGEVTVRMIFEGYGKPEDNQKKMADLEALGLDVRTLKSGKKVHHKFAVLDSGTADARVITGSANWSMSSYRNYDENVLFMDQEPEATASYGEEFQRLWNQSDEYGAIGQHAARSLPAIEGVPDRLDAFFNSPRILEKNTDVDHVLTSQLTRLIDGAQSELLIATTRVRLVPVMESLKAAAARGVKIKLLISQDDYRDLWKRADYLVNQPNIELRIKFYNLKPASYITSQMHNKFMIVDQRVIETGSFNWSDSSENAHIENVLELKESGAADVMADFVSRFSMMWDRGRAEFVEYRNSLAQKKQAGELPACGFAPTSLSYDEVRELLKLAPKCGRAE